MHKKHYPTAEYRYFLYDPEGSGMMYYKSVEERDRDANAAIEDYLSDDGWDDDVRCVTVGEVTGAATQCDKHFPDGDLDEDGCDQSGEYFGDYEYKCRYETQPLEEASPEREGGQS